MKITLRKNLWAGIFSALFGVVFWLLIPVYIRSKVITNTSAVGPDYMPRLVAGLMILLGVGLIVQSLVFKKDSTVTIVLRQELHALIIFVVLLVYVLLLPIAGYLIATPLFGCGLLALTRDKKWPHYVVLIALSGLVYCLFRFLLHVPLP